MHILIQTCGSAGDVHPFVGLGRALADRGHDVTVFANGEFERTIASAGLAFVEHGTVEQYRELVRDPELWDPLRGTKVVFEKGVIAGLELCYRTIAERVRPGETVIVASTLGIAAHLVRETHDARLVIAHLAPSVFRSEFRAPRFAGVWLPDGAPRLVKRLFWWIGDRVVDPSICPKLNEFRAGLDLPPVRRIFNGWIHEGDALLALFPEWFSPPQPDWPAGIRYCGFPLFDEGELAPLDPSLAAWLHAGPAPIVVTHGSANIHSRDVFHALAAAARTLGRRVLLVTTNPDAVPASARDRRNSGNARNARNARDARDARDGGDGGDDRDGRDARDGGDALVRHELRVPFSHVFPRAAAVVHHGGIGTVARTLAAGVPHLTVPMGFDQFDNASRLEALGVGLTLPAPRCTAAAAERALTTLLYGPRAAAFASTARTLASRLDASAAARAAACDAIEALGDRRATSGATPGGSPGAPPPQSVATPSR